MIPKKILIIQTAFIGDTILATSVAEELHHTFPSSEIFLLVRKENQTLFTNHPFLKIITHDKSRKYSSLVSLIKKIRSEQFDAVINLHRYFSSNILTLLSGAKYTAGFKSVFSTFFSHTAKHSFASNTHEIHRYHQLTEPLTQQKKIFLPKIYPPDTPKEFNITEKYVCLFPGSLWPTKQLPPAKWIELIQKFSDDVRIYLCGSLDDVQLCEYIKNKSNKSNVLNLAGKYSILEVASIMKNARRVYVNDSAPLHIASALNIPVTAFFCSTVTDFGFYPLSDNNQVVEVKHLPCRPCGIHGHKQCPKSHFRCGLEIDINEVKLVD